MQDGVPVFDLRMLARYLATEAYENDNPFRYYRDFGLVEGFSDDITTIRPGTKFTTDHLLLMEVAAFPIYNIIGVDQYGSVVEFTNRNSIQEEMLAIMADAMRNYISDQEVQHVEAWHQTNHHETFDERELSTAREGVFIR